MKISPIAYAIHDEGDSRVFGESVTIVSVNDEAAGEFIEIKQCIENIGEVRLSYEELMLVVEIANLLEIKK
jgi:hypothetical protein